MPPGPRGWPLFGNMFQLDLNNPLPQFAIWREKFGKIFKFNLMGQDIVLVSPCFLLGFAQACWLSFRLRWKQSLLMQGAGTVKMTE